MKEEYEYDDRCLQDDLKGGGGTSANVQLTVCVNLLVCVFTSFCIFRTARKAGITERRQENEEFEFE